MVELRIPVGDGRTLSTVRRLGELVSEEYDGDVAVIRAVLEPKAIGQLERATGIDLRPVVLRIQADLFARTPPRDPARTSAAVIAP